MQVFRDLNVLIPEAKASDFFDRLEKMLDDGWSRDLESEGRARQFSEPNFRYFRCSSGPRRESAMLAMYKGESDEWYVSNIVPAEKSRLSHDEYNSILEEFFEKYIKPVSTELGFTHKISDSSQTLEDWIGEDAANKLRVFSRSTNRSTGSSHPMDRERWLAFIYAIYDGGCRLPTDRLLRWLIEEDNWPEEWAHDLVLEYEFALSVLRYQDK